MSTLQSIFAMLGIGGLVGAVLWARSLLERAEARGELRERYRWSTAMVERQDELDRGDAEAFAGHTHRVLEIHQETERRINSPTPAEVKDYVARSKRPWRRPKVPR